MTTRKVKKLRDIQPERTPMPVQDPVERAENFDEVATGYSEDDALREAERCLLCPKAKCVDACPVSIDIPGFLIGPCKDIYVMGQGESIRTPAEAVIGDLILAEADGLDGSALCQ